MKSRKYKPRSTRKPPEVRLWARVDKSGDCWIWQGAFHKNGYGKMGDGGFPGKTLSTHRVAWASVNGPIPDELCVLHRCDNRKCVNPAHLWLGTKRENTQDMMAKKRARWSNYTGQLTNAEICRRYQARKKAGLVMSGQQ